MKPDGITSCGRPYELHLEMCGAEQKWAYSLIKSRPLVKKKVGVLFLPCLYMLELM